MKPDESVNLETSGIEFAEYIASLKDFPPKALELISPHLEVLHRINLLDQIMVEDYELARATFCNLCNIDPAMFCAHVPNEVLHLFKIIQGKFSQTDDPIDIDAIAYGIAVRNESVSNSNDIYTHSGKWRTLEGILNSGGRIFSKISALKEGIEIPVSKGTGSEIYISRDGVRHGQSAIQNWESYRLRERLELLSRRDTRPILSERYQVCMSIDRIYDGSNNWFIAVSGKEIMNSNQINNISDLSDDGIHVFDRDYSEEQPIVSSEDLVNGGQGMIIDLNKMDFRIIVKESGRARFLEIINQNKENLPNFSLYPNIEDWINRYVVFSRAIYRNPKLIEDLKISLYSQLPKETGVIIPTGNTGEVIDARGDDFKVRTKKVHLYSFVKKQFPTATLPDISEYETRLEKVIKQLRNKKRPQS